MKKTKNLLIGGVLGTADFFDLILERRVQIKISLNKIACLEYIQHITYDQQSKHVVYLNSHQNKQHIYGLKLRVPLF